MKSFLLIVVAVAVALQVQATSAADYNGVFELQNKAAPALLLNLGRWYQCSVSTVAIIGEDLVKLLNVCFTDIQSFASCLVGFVPQIWQDVSLNFSECINLS